MRADLEQQLAALKREILKGTELESSKMKRNEKYKTFKRNLSKSKRFLTDHNLQVVSSDKTYGLVLTDQVTFESRLLNILKDEKTYKKVDGKQAKIEKQANKLLKNFCSYLPKHQLQKLMSAGSRPAHFQAFIKDHKHKDGETFPLRPIASVHNTAIEKVDWLVSKILGQLADLVPANVKNSNEVTKLLENLNTTDLTPNMAFFSLDVVSLYPSIHIGFGIDFVVEFAEQNWQTIDNWGLTLDALRKCLTFISYNYEIKINNETYLQIKGCPMGRTLLPRPPL